VDISQVVAELRNERSRLDKAIAALEGVSSRNGRRSLYNASSRRGSRRRISAAGRKRLSMLLKKRWAAGKMGKRKMKSAA
jgi:hypothetical protein